MESSLFRTPDDGLPEDLAPFTIIRTETVLSRLPIHNLAKKGRVDISINRRGDGGEMRLKWEVSHSDRYGQPRQLAYKVDTLIVNRRLDEKRRPLPSLIRLGSLKQICQELGISPNGKNTNDLKTALLQNATAFINANLSYKAADGTEKRLEAGFTRYGVVFTGEVLPDGRKADAVYIVLNDPYRDVVNHAPLRPLNYDYLRELRPAAQRFYEILSYRIYAALRYKRPIARIAYSEYCLFSAQQRYYDYEHFRVQMYKVQKPHLESGYLKSVQYESTTDREGKPDWILCYEPGPKAETEFQNFSGKQLPVVEEDRPAELPAPVKPPPKATPTRTSPPPPRFDSGLLNAIMSRGITRSQAEKILEALQPADPHATDQLLDQLEWGDQVIAQSDGGFRNPPGFYVSILRDRIVPPDAFESSRRRKLREESERADQEQAAQRLELELAYDDYRILTVDRYIAKHLTDRDFEAAVETRKDEFRNQYPGLAAQTLREVAVGRVRAELEKHVPELMDFAAFCQNYRTDS